MKQNRIALPGALLACALSACAQSVDADPDETVIEPGPTAEFDPGSGILPLPTNLVFDPASGTLDLPPQCNESDTARDLREGVLNTLDGFGTYKAGLRATFSAPVDMASLDGRVFLFRVQRAGVPDDPASATPIPLVAQASPTVRFDANCANPAPVDSVVFVPTVPLDDAATYAAAILEGVTTADGDVLQPSSVWTLVRQGTNPVTVDGDVIVDNRTPFDPSEPEGRATILGINQLWNYHATFLPFLDGAIAAQGGGALDRRDLLIAWAFNTQTIEAPLDPTSGVGPASTIATDTTNDTTAVDIQPGATGEQVVDAALCGGLGQAPGCGVCDVVPCDKVEQVKVGAIVSPDYQVAIDSIPSAWSNPITPDVQRDAQIPYITFVPDGPTPDEGWPVVVFGHGITRDKSDLFAIGPQLAAAGIATIAIDHVGHGSRAVRIATEGPCADVDGAPPVPSAHPECYAPFLASDLGVARDNVRQTVLDQLKLIEVIKACGDDDCDGLAFDPDRIGYIGQSLGTLIGVTTVSVSPDIKAAVLNVGGVSWVDVAIFTQVPGFICPVIDRLIDAGILSGTKWDGGANADALCLMPDLWRPDPAFQSFASTARWIYDPADGANFIDLLRAKNTNVLVQKVVGDPVVPNESTDQLGGLLGLTPAPANINQGQPAPSAPAAAAANGWIDYETSEANVYGHGSLLAPAPGLEGQAATAQMQTDAITYFLINL